MARIDLPQSKLRARKRRQSLFAVIKLIAIGVGIVGIVLGVSWLPHLRITKVEVAGVEGTAADAIEEAAQRSIAGTYAFVFPKNNVLIYPKTSLIQNLYEQFPRLAAIEVEAKHLRIIGVTVRERIPGSVWCGVTLDTRVPCLFMDEDGVAYEAAAQFSGTVYTEYFGSTTGALPKQYLTSKEFRSLAALVQAFKDKEGESIARVAVDEQNDARATFESGFTLLFAALADSGDIYERFLLAKTAEPFKSRALKDFEYLDLRFGDRLYYKLKTE